jgi:predicted transcriptional regulator
MKKRNCPHIKITLPSNEALPFWTEIIVTLINDHGYSYCEIAKQIKISVAAVKYLVSHPQKHPRHDDFDKLMALYYQHAA